MRFSELLEDVDFRVALDPKLVEEHRSLVHRDAEFQDDTVVIEGVPSHIGRGTYHAGATLKDGIELGGKNSIGVGATIEPEVRAGNSNTVFSVGRLSTIGGGALFTGDAIIGDRVVIPADTRFGHGVILPSSQTVVALSPFGESNRTVTIHGSHDGPRFSIGCQNSVDWGRISKRIRGGTETTAESAAHYAAYLDVFDSIGKVVQTYFDGQLHRVEELAEEATQFSQDCL